MFIANLTVKVVGFVYIILLAKILTKHEFGIFSYSQSLIQFFSPLVGMGLSYGFLIFASRFKKRMLDYFFLSQKLALGFNISFFLVAVLFSFIFPFPFKEANVVFIILLIGQILKSHREIILSFFRVLKKNNVFALLTMENVLIVAVFGLSGAYVWRLYGLIIFILFAQVCSLFLAYRHSKKYFIENHKSYPQSIKDILKISIAASFTNLISYMLYSIDTFLVGTLLKSSEKVSEYYIATLIPFNLSFIPLSLMAALFPYISENYNNLIWLKRSYVKMLLVTFLVNLLIVLFLFSFSKSIILTLFGESYLSSEKLFKILLVGFLFSGTFRVVSGNFLASLGKVNQNLLLAIIAGVLNVTLDYSLIEKYSTFGAAISTAFTMFFSGILGSLFVIYNLTWRKKCL